MKDKLQQILIIIALIVLAAMILSECKKATITFSKLRKTPLPTVNEPISDTQSQIDSLKYEIQELRDGVLLLELKIGVGHD